MSKIPQSKLSILGVPVLAMLAPFPAVCFIVTLFTDLAYAQTANMQWANMSAWLLAVGLFVAVFAVIAGLIDFVSEPALRALSATWAYAIGSALVLVLAIFNSFIHSRDAYTSVVPTGLTLSVITVVVLLVTAWFGAALVYRHGVGVRGEASR